VNAIGSAVTPRPTPQPTPRPAATARADSGVRRIRLAAGMVAVGAVLVVGLAACAKPLTGTAIAAGNPPIPLAPIPAGTPGGGTTTAAPPASGVTGDLSQQAQQTCAQFPKSAATSSFGIPDVTVTADSGSTLAGGIKQIKCVLNSSNGFRANVVVQGYPAGILATTDQYFQLMQRQFGSLKKLTITGADTAGIFTDNNGAATVDEAFAAKKSSDGSVEVVIAGVAQEPGIDTKLVAFVTALVNS
jgi:hypothetical protein